VGWLIVEDVAMVLVLVLLPPLADWLRSDVSGAATGVLSLDLLISVLVTFGKVAIFIALMLIVGRRVFPRLLWYVASTNSNELFILSVIAVAIGIAYGSAMLFGVSFALGAFFAGMVMRESDLSHRAAHESLPLRDAFSVLFFVSVGMLFDPNVLIEQPFHLVATLGIIIIVKSLAAFLLVLAFRYPLNTALTVSASLAQIGEFSFILVSLGVSLSLMTERGRDLVLAGAIISIMLNPLWFALLDRVMARVEKKTAENPSDDSGDEAPHVPMPVSALTGHIVLVGHGRVGSVVSRALREAGTPLLVIEDNPGIVERLKQEGVEVITGNAAAPDMLQAANVGAARGLLVAMPDGFVGGQFVAKARAIIECLQFFARAHSEEEVAHLKVHGATLVIMGETEIARAMLAQIAGAARRPESRAAVATGAPPDSNPKQADGSAPSAA
jgi:CPA2 family monovalent cation:H+ antiporter-2